MKLPGQKMKRTRLGGLARSRSGCSAVIAEGLLLTLLLILNGLFVKTFLLADKNWGDEIRLQQALQFVIPILLIAAEYWVFDLLFSRYTKFRS